MKDPMEGTRWADLKGPALQAEVVVDNFRQSVYRGDAIDKDAPQALKTIIRNGWWRRPDKKGKPFQHIDEFIQAKPLPGLGVDLETVKRIVEHDAEAISMLEEERKKPGGRPPKTVTNGDSLSGRPRGNGRARAMRDLLAKRPDLHKQVLAGKLTPHGAMVEARLRKRQITITDDPVDAARLIRKYFTGDRLIALIKGLSEAQMPEVERK